MKEDSFYSKYKTKKAKTQDLNSENWGFIKILLFFQLQSYEKEPPSLPDIWSGK
jgi:hypothetical protein